MDAEVLDGMNEPEGENSPNEANLHPAFRGSGKRQ